MTNEAPTLRTIPIPDPKGGSLSAADHLAALGLTRDDLLTVTTDAATIVELADRYLGYAYTNHDRDMRRAAIERACAVLARLDAEKVE
jgi:hypothetical protein